MTAYMLGADRVARTALRHPNWLVLHGHLGGRQCPMEGR